MEQFVNASNELLRKKGYRLTPQRYMILSVIQEAQGHVTVEQISERVQQRNPYVSLSTIYRTLELLKKLDLIRESRLAGDQVHYEAARGLAHHHLVCRRCHTTIHLDETLLGNLNERLQEEYRFHGLALNLVAAGYCDECWQEMQREGLGSECSAETPEAEGKQGQGQQIDHEELIEPVDMEEEIEGDGDVEEHAAGADDPA